MFARSVFLPAALLLLQLSSAAGENLKSLRQEGKQALIAFQEHRDAEGRRLFQQFLAKVNASDTALRDTQIEVTIGVLGCAVGDRGMGREALDYVLANGKGIEQIRTTLQQVRTACSGSEAVSLVGANNMGTLMALDSAPPPRVSGKGGAPMSTRVSTPVPSLTLAHIESAELEKRLQETEDPATALKPTLERFGEGHGVVTDHFIVVSHGDESQAQGVAACLEGYRAILGRDYDMITPTHRITVYNSNDVYEEAARLHGINLPQGTIAYSVYDDLSMTGAGDSNHCGSLAHELVHLMIRDNFGDAPAWLEEGLASAVALSVPEGDHLSFQRGWRDEVLQSEWRLHPPVEQLTSLTWDDFSPTNSSATASDFHRVAAVQAMASVFVRYLASQHKLEKVYFAVRKQDLRADLRDHSTRRKGVEKELGKSLKKVNSDFNAWFKEDQGHESSRPTPSVTRETAGKPCEPLPAANAPAELTAQQAPAPPPCETKGKK
jgi:hypothetical protein